MHVVATLIICEMAVAMSSTPIPTTVVDSNSPSQKLKRYHDSLNDLSEHHIPFSDKLKMVTKLASVVSAAVPIFGALSAAFGDGLADAVKLVIDGNAAAQKHAELLRVIRNTVAEYEEKSFSIQYSTDVRQKVNTFGNRLNVGFDACKTNCKGIVDYVKEICKTSDFVGIATAFEELLKPCASPVETAVMAAEAYDFETFIPETSRAPAASIYESVFRLYDARGPTVAAAVLKKIKDKCKVTICDRNYVFKTIVKETKFVKRDTFEGCLARSVIIVRKGNCSDVNKVVNGYRADAALLLSYTTLCEPYVTAPDMAPILTNWVSNSLNNSLFLLTQFYDEFYNSSWVSSLPKTMKTLSEYSYNSEKMNERDYARSIYMSAAAIGSPRFYYQVVVGSSNYFTGLRCHETSCIQTKNNKFAAILIRRSSEKEFVFPTEFIRLWTSYQLDRYPQLAEPFSGSSAVVQFQKAFGFFDRKCDLNVAVVGDGNYFMENRTLAYYPSGCVEYYLF